MLLTTDNWAPTHVFIVKLQAFDTFLLSFVSSSSSDLSSNPFECDCKLFRLVSWLQEKGVRVQRPDAMLCNHPPELRHQPLLNVSLLTCGMKRKHSNTCKFYF